MSSLIPAKKLPLLTPAEAFGPDIDRFRDSNQSLVAWWDKQSQWWRLKGTLQTNRGRTIGYQIGFFDRHTQNDFFGAIPARWITTRSFAAHFALTDPMNGDNQNTFRFWQKGGPLSQSPGFAADDRFHVELGGWYVYRREDNSLTAFANGDGDSVHLELTQEKPLAYHGQSGYTEKNVWPSFYCSYPRLRTKGRILLDGKLEEVSGLSWLDHEKSTTSKFPSQTHGHLSKCTDTILLQLSNGFDFMLSARGEEFLGSLIDQDGKVQHLITSEIKIENIEYWISPNTQSRYPIKRRIIVEPLNIYLDVRASLPTQELDTSRSTLSSQWEGMVVASGQIQNAQVTGSGFMELLGYDTRPRTKLVEFLTGH